MEFQREITRLEMQQAEVVQQQKMQTGQIEQQLKNRFETVLNWLSHLGGWSELVTLVLLVFLEMYAYSRQSHTLDLPFEQAVNGTNSKATSNYLKQRARQCWKRAHDEQSSEKTQKNNLVKAKELFKRLYQLGIQVEMDSNDSKNITFSHQKFPKNHVQKSRSPKIRTEHR